ncbi:NADH-quinone oxidoreductase subunit L [Campylobacter geochelonis]|uniref:NADH dehydrogenase subunit L n=1 Tax=Campylobacter geochelonis TaxID=1780362 RepID=A0A128EED8_9BACT|nr:NADH-quinone oxidoreductase subunit L [Campylobacter geochelonis]QKF70550.1 NADH:quinone oxidoreductase I, membrane subunit L [Campylobacter geochelonis]CZE46058.1 NADH dehydrogenase subunit L [Campylobacter geochelonis]CZE46578.1 NADH dehydrogenase subunit L [Campylobacter geochelonis]CZE50408.1 NADH dehydrogenase subunit L [Campylobacter geochelonis]
MMFFVLTALFAPLLSALLAGIFAQYKKSVAIGVICSFLIVLSTISSFALLEIAANDGDIVVYLSDFIYVGFLNLDHGLIIDTVSAVMMVTVGIVSSIVHIYSIGYMEHDAGFNRFFSYLGLFVFSMLVLVMSDNFVGLFIGWEGVGLCSWLLIGFWYERDGISWCANEAFIMNRVADLGMLLGIFMIYKYTGSLKYDDVFALVPNLPHFVVAWMGAFLFIGAMGKSAQFPFHTWLADAMAGPTPVSALIHAATMVTAGVYLMIRANEIFSAAPQVSEFIAYLGAFVAVFAASMALVHKDLKKIIAYSTLSQLGYMFVAAGLGAYWIALFHLVTHAFFKSLLFLGAGNVMHAMNDELDIKKMGGLYKFMRPTAILMIIASLALAGFYPFAGFFSKDKILEAAFADGNYLIWAVLLVGAIMTAFYSFRLIMLVFFGKPKYEHHPHEAKIFMLIALAPLGILAIIAGFFEHKFHSAVTKILPNYEMDIEHNVALGLILLTLVCVLLSTIFAIFAYKKEIFKPSIENSKIYKILSNQYFIPQFYDKFLVKGYYKISQQFAKMDEAFIDKSVDAIAYSLVKLGSITNEMNSGNLSFMLRWMVVGFAVMLALAFLI